MLTSTHQTQLIYCMLRSSSTVRQDALVFGLIHIAVMAVVDPFLFHLEVVAISFPCALLQDSVEQKTQGGHQITNPGK